jgi:EAL domain-containing protein (putative c-di-GMP-specific phosphodiesterase class I)
MGLRVTAEGVETGAQSQFLAAAGCNELQGFLYSRAVPDAQLAGLIDSLKTRKSAAA